MNLSEQEKIQNYIRTGDLKWVGELYKEYIHLVYGVGLKYLKNKDDAQDAVSQIFEKLIVELKKHQVTNFKSWLFVLTKNYCLMELRRTKRVENSSIEDMEFALPVHHYEEQIDETGLAECIQQLKEKQKRCVELFYLSEMCYQDISEELDITLNDVKSAIQNGKRNLKICLEKKRENI